MNEEETTPRDSAEETKTTVDDPRFEVKWRKKEQSGTASTPSTAPNAGSATAAGTDTRASVAELERELESERQRVKDLQDRWQRAAADLVNLRRRTEQERGDVEQFASMLLVQELLPVLDNFERALATIPGNLSMLTWIQGVMLIERHLRAILEQRGLAPIEAQGQPFNPHYHEAVGEREQEGSTPGTVIAEYQKGYTMHGRVIRPSLVEIAKAPRPAPASAGDKEGEVAPEASTTDAEEAEHIAEQAGDENSGP